MLIEQAKALKVGDIVVFGLQRWKVNGAVKLWKRSPEGVKVPLKRGLYDYAYLTENNMNNGRVE